MPTGYTVGILEGTTKDFKEFAKQCSRAFIVHMRDEPTNSEYKKREAGNYHTEQITEAENKLKMTESLSDEKLVAKERANLIDQKNCHLGARKKEEANRIKMDVFLADAKAYKPPTNRHENIAEFMIDQLEKTIDLDCKGTYHADELKSIDIKLKNINAKDIRIKIEDESSESIKYHTKEHNEEVIRCTEHNKWYSDFIESI
jgi:hypothetical protein